MKWSGRNQTSNLSVEQRFFEKVNKTKLCWHWNGCKTNGGYGHFGFNKKLILAHRFSYIYFIGEIQKGLFVLHKCDNPSCVNPDHLFLGNQKDNMIDMASKGRTKVTKGVKNHLSKLSENQIIYIRSKKIKYGDIAKLAKELKVTGENISSIIKRKTWKHI